MAATMGDPGGYVKKMIIAAALLLISSAASAADTLPFIEDDYAKAVARAQAKNLPIFVEAWAPW